MEVWPDLNKNGENVLPVGVVNGLSIEPMWCSGQTDGTVIRRPGFKFPLDQRTSLASGNGKTTP